jgi:hypothetical protein
MDFGATMLSPSENHTPKKEICVEDRHCTGRKSRADRKGIERSSVPPGRDRLSGWLDYSPEPAAVGTIAVGLVGQMAMFFSTSSACKSRSFALWSRPAE